MSLLRANGGGLGGAGSPGGALGNFYSHTIDQSLRFEDGDSAYFARTNDGAASSATLTVLSCWVKRGNLGSIQMIFSSATSAPNVCGYVSFIADNKLQVYLDKTAAGSDELVLTTTAVFRDVSSWYHIVVVFNAAESANADKMKIYVNGVRQAVTATATGSAVTTQRVLADGVNLTIGKYFNDNYYLDGYLAEYHVVDGVAGIDHDDFGETKDGIWIAKEYLGGHGNNGFHLPFSTTPGSSVDYDGGANNIRWTNATQYDIASDDDFCLEFFIKANLEAKTTYAIGAYAVSGPHFMLQLGSGTTGNIYAYYGNGLANNFDTTSYMTTTDWHHFAYVRESGTYRFYIDGVQRHTATNGGTAAFDLSQFNVGDAYPAASAPFDGLLSNLRFTIGAARYGSGTTFTVPTSTLTNDSSNVKLLAYTTSTLTADASTAAVSGSITAGTPVFRRDNPFSDIIGKDAAGSNDFLSSGLFFTDIVPDSPTNKFAVGNHLSSTSNNTFTEGNLKVTGSGVNYYNYLSSFGMETGGKYYFEVYSNRRDSSYWAVGICKPESFSHTMSVYNTAGSMALQQGASVYYLNSTIGTTTNRYNTTAYLFSFAIDLDNNIFHFRADGGTWENSGDPAAGTGGYAIPADLQGQTLMPWFGPNGANYQVLNFGQDSSFANNKTSGSASAADGNGKGDFFYAPPSGFLALASSSLPEPAIIDGSEHFTPYIYTADNASTRSFTGLGFQPDFLWFKARSQAFSHRLFNSVVGVGTHAYADRTDRPAWDSLTSFDADGFSVETDGTAGNLLNYLTSTYVAWAWKAGTTASGSESGNNPAFSSSSNADAGFSIVSYTGTGSAGTVSHGCGAKPTMIMIKNRSADENWAVYHAGTASDPETDYMILNLVNAVADSANWWNDTAPTDSVFTVGTDHTVNADGEDYIAYCFADVEGYMKASHYIGNNTNNFVYTGFRPAFLILKKTTQSTTYGWQIYDTSRSPINVALLPGMWADTGAAEAANTYPVNIHSSGFELTGAGANQNATGVRYVYFAIADQPAKFSNAR